MVDDCFADKVGIVAGVDDNTFAAVGNEVAIGGEITDDQGTDIHGFILVYL